MKTAIYQNHLDSGARMVDFAGWQMPIQYASQLAEHHAVRQDAGMFDVSHMRSVDITGPQSRDFLRHLLANDVNKLKQPGRALYSCMLNDAGGIIEKEMPLHRSNVAIYNPNTGKPDRVGIRVEEDGSKVRFFKSDNNLID